ncbi:MAG: hypothetical protein QXQ57_01195 [Sulfolobales archaeon]
MDIGFVKIDITPPIGIRLGGYGHRIGMGSTHIIDPLYLRLLYLSNRSGEAIAIIQLDLLGIYSKDANTIRNIVGKRLGIDRKNIMVSTTHTHSAPETVIPMWTHTFPMNNTEKEIYDRWFRILLEGVEEASEEVKYRINSVYRIKYGSKIIGNLCFNRAFKDGLVDDELGVLSFESDENRVMVVNYACHPVTNVGLGISADYPGVVIDTLRRRGFEAIFLTGGCGDVDPLKKGVRYMSFMGSIIGEEANSIIASTRNIDYSEDLYVETARVVLETRRPSKDLDTLLREYESLKTLYGDPRNLLFDPSWIDLLYLDEELDLLEKSLEKIEAELQIIRIGDKSLVIGFPGEILSETAIEIKRFARSIGFENIILSAYTNDYIGYIPIRRSFEENKYEARLAKWSFVAENSEEIIRWKTFEMVKAIKRSRG